MRREVEADRLRLVGQLLQLRPLRHLRQAQRLGPRIRAAEERYLRAGDYAATQLYAGRLAGIFEEDAALALELHEPEDERIATEVAALARLFERLVLLDADQDLVGRSVFWL